MMKFIRTSIAEPRARPRSRSNRGWGIRIACAAALAATAGMLPAAAGGVEVKEGETATVEVPRRSMLPSGHAHRLDYKYATHNGSAQKNLDFEPVSGELTFWPGVNSLNVEIETLEDTCDESDETFSLKLTGGTCTWTHIGGGSCPLSVTEMTFEVTIKNVAHDGSDSYLNTAQGCSGGSGSTFGE